MPINNRYDFVFLCDVQDGNPNGDPDAGNMPRVDADTGKGLISDVCIKRKIRNYVAQVKGETPPYDIYVKEKAVLNNLHQRAYIASDSDPKKAKQDDIFKARNWMCQNFYDIRTFGAVMSTEVNCGQVRGPVQLTFGRSIDRVEITEHAVTRCAVTNERDAAKERTIGRKYTIPYGLYRFQGFINTNFANQTGFSEEDLELLWASFKNMFDLDRSAGRGLMTARRLIVFKHDSSLGCAQASSLFDSVKVSLNEGVTVPRKFTDYSIHVGPTPEGVTVLEKI
jgi:CRISPR-associated protein Csd2